MRITRLARGDDGAEVIEFALVFPILALLLFGALYGIFSTAAHVSLAHATSRGVRYAAIPVDPVTQTYRTTDEVENYVDGHTPFFTAERCVTTVSGDARENAPVVLEVACDFPNPFGRAANAMRDVVTRGSTASPDSEAVTISARAEGRRE